MTLASSTSAIGRRAPAPAGTPLRRRLLGISLDEATFGRRGFAPGVPATQQRLEDVGRTFVRGYLAGLEADTPETIAAALAHVPLEDKGFAFEGAAMALALLDLMTPWRRDRFARWVAGPGAPHVYMVHVGAGWAMARLGQRRPRGLPLDPLLYWLALDGYGFHEGYFGWRRTIAGRRRPSGLGDYAGRAFDQGLGRSMWFVECGDPARIAGRIGAFPPERRGDLWSGIGLAAAYAGGVDASVLAAVRDAAGAHLPDARQGVAFAAKARERAQNPAAHTELACAVLVGAPAGEVAAATDEALDRVPRDTFATTGVAYEAWRRGIRERLSGRREARP